MSATVTVRVDSLVANLKAKRAELAKQANAHLAKIASARETVQAEGWAASIVGPWADGVAEALKSGDYRFNEYGELRQVNRNGKTISTNPPTADLDAALAELAEDEQRVTSSRDRHFRSIDGQLRALELTEESKRGESGTVEVPLGFDPLEAFAEIAVSEPEYVDNYSA